MKMLSIEEMQKAYLELMEEFDGLCRTQRLRYDLAGGSLLGAVRHGGFIPWDNDIDICMPRPDYERMLKLRGDHKLALDRDRELISCRSGSFPRHYARYIRYDIRRKALYAEDEDCPYIGIDIFTVDGIPDNPLLFKLQLARLRLLRKLLLISLSKKNTSSRGRGVALVKNLIRPVLKKAGPYRIASAMDRICSQADFGSAEFVGALNGMYGERERWRKEDYLPQQIFSFEDREFSGFKNYDIYLSNLYRDYQKLPPLSQQVPHCDEGYFVDPGKQKRYRF